MNEEVKQELVKRLRSGDYKQGRSRLRKRRKDEDGGEEDCYCCLGVLCDIAVEAGVTKWSDGVRACSDSSEVAVPLKRKYGAEDALPTKAVVKWAGLEQKNPSVAFNKFIPVLLERGYTKDEIRNMLDIPLICYNDPEWMESHVKTLAALNDRGFTFDDIADIIERCM